MKRPHENTGIVLGSWKILNKLFLCLRFYVHMGRGGGRLREKVQKGCNLEWPQGYTVELNLLLGTSVTFYGTKSKLCKAWEACFYHAGKVPKTSISERLMGLLSLFLCTFTFLPSFLSSSAWTSDGTAPLQTSPSGMPKSQPEAPPRCCVPNPEWAVNTGRSLNPSHLAEKQYLQILL